MTSVFQAIQENKRLQRSLKTTTKGDPNARYKGPDGELMCHLKKLSHLSKDGKDMALFEFAVAPGEQYEGDKLVIVHVFADNSAFSAEDNLARFFSDVQQLGIGTEGKEPSAIEKDIDRKIAKKTLFKIAVTDSTAKYPNVEIVGPVEGEDVPVEDEPVNAGDGVGDDEWEEETAEEADESLVGALCTYEGDTCVIDTHDEAKGEVNLADAEDPDTIWYEFVPFTDIELVMEEE